MKREPWVPDDVTDEELPYYYGTLAEGIHRISWTARQIGAHDVLAGLDRLGARLRDERQRVLTEHFDA